METEKQEEKREEKPIDFNLKTAAFDVGFSIAIPLVVLALIGRLLDNRFDTSPFLLLGGILLSIIISSTLVFRKMKRYF